MEGMWRSSIFPCAPVINFTDTHTFYFSIPRTPLLLPEVLMALQGVAEMLEVEDQQ